MSDKDDQGASIIRMLRRNGYMATPQRIAIGRFALNRQDHPTAQRIFSDVKKIYPTISLATVYKTLQILKEIGLIQELNLPRGQTRFDANTSPHIHLVCNGCGAIRDIKDSTLRDMISRVASIEHFAVTAQHFDIYGTCQSCIRANNLEALRATART